MSFDAFKASEKEKYPYYRRCEFRGLYLVSGHLRELSESFESNSAYYKVQQFMIDECERYVGFFMCHHFITVRPKTWTYDPEASVRVRDRGAGGGLIVVDYENGYHDLLHNNTGKKQIDNKQGNYNVTAYIQYIINRFPSNELCKELFECDIAITNYNANDDQKQDEMNTNMEISVMTTDDKKNDFQVIYDCNGDILYKYDTSDNYDKNSFKSYKIGDMISIEINTKQATIIFKKNNNEYTIIKDIDISKQLCVMIKFKPKNSICQCILSNCKVTKL